MSIIVERVVLAGRCAVCVPCYKGGEAGRRVGRDEGSKKGKTRDKRFGVWGGRFFTFSFLASFGGLFWGLGIFFSLHGGRLGVKRDCWPCFDHVMFALCFLLSELFVVFREENRTSLQERVLFVE